MLIAVDYRLSRNPHSGMGVYVKEIVKHLRVKKGIKILPLVNNKSTANNTFSKIIELVKEQYWVQFTFPSAARQKGVSVIYFPNPPVSLFTSIPIMLTIPDLSFYRDTQIPWYIKYYLFVVYKLSAKCAFGITTFSENSKNDIAAVLGVKKEKIVIAHPAVKKIFTNFTASKNDFKVLAKYSVPKEYLITVPGTYIPRKNMRDIVKAIKILPDKINKKITIISVGRVGDSYHRTFLDYCIKNKVSQKFIFLDNVSDSDLAILYKHAKCLLSPSLYEGFGLPALEALSVGTPAIVYNNSSQPEIVGKAGTIVNNFKEMSKSINSLLKKNMQSTTLRDKQSLSLRDRQSITLREKRLINERKSWAKKYSWVKSADLIYKKLIESSI